ncbi:MAG: radical SAM protein [Promethearchaeota archaeon]|nr:MAG: radical SAM protein [Candidatus Lokiarchaeota archaeon]
MNNLSCAVWEITLGCNMSCKHCGSSAGSVRPDELSLQECYKVCEQLAEVNCQMVSLMGGEPFFRKDWFEIARCVKDLGMDLAFVTNGWTMPDVVEELAILEPEVVGLSMDGMEEIHDSIRKSGSFQRVVKAIDLLNQHNIQTTVITTISKTNLKELPKIRKLLKTKEVNWQLQTAMPFGNFDRNLVIDLEEYYSTAMFIVSENIKNSYRDLPVVGAHCYGYFSHLLPNNEKWYGCTAGKSTVGITSNGNVVGCLSMGGDRLIEGNLRERSFRDIWEDPNSFSYNRKFKIEDLGENCRVCEYGRQCKGGCNSVSIHISNSLHNSKYCLRRIEETILDIEPSKLNNHPKTKN